MVCPNCNHHTSEESRFCSGCGFRLEAAAPHKAPVEAKLALLSFSCSRQRLWLVVEGRVKNIAPQPLENVFAVAQFYTREDKLVKFDYALVQHDMVFPGQVSAYLITSIDNPEIWSCDIHFKTLFGSHIPFRDDRQGDLQDNLSQTRTSYQSSE